MRPHIAKPFAAAAGVLAALLLPAAAEAHHVNSEAECVLVDNAPTVQLRASFVSFETPGSPSSLRGKVAVDGVNRFPLGPVPVTWDGDDNGTWVFRSPGEAGKSYSVKTYWSWFQGDDKHTDGEDLQTDTCPTPATPPTPPTAPTPPTPTPPTPPVPPVTPPATATGYVLPEQVVSGHAALRGPSGCVDQAFRARVTGRSIDSVTFYLDGKRVKRLSSAGSVRIHPNKVGFGRHRVVALVHFTEASDTPSRRLPLTFRRCARQSVSPQFTG
jgi:hypothetical protein